MRALFAAAAAASLPSVAPAIDHAFSTGAIPNISSISKLYYHTGQNAFTGGGLGDWTSLYYDFAGSDGGLGGVKGGPLPMPGPPPAPISPPIHAFDAIHAEVGGGFTMRGLRVGYYQFNNPGNTSLKVSVYSNDASDSILPGDLGGSAGLLGEYTVFNLPNTEGAYELELYGFQINVPVPHMWIGLQFTDGYALPLLGDSVQSAIGDSDNVLGWTGDGVGFPPGLYNIDNGSTWADLSLAVGIPSPGVLGVLGMGAVVAPRRRR